MKKLRKEIDTIDTKILNLLCCRLEIAREIANIKKKKNLKIYDPKREKVILDKLRKDAEREGISPAFAEKFYRILLSYSRKEMRRCTS